MEARHRTLSLQRFLASLLLCPLADLMGDNLCHSARLVVLGGVGVAEDHLDPRVAHHGSERDQVPTRVQGWLPRTAPGHGCQQENAAGWPELPLLGSWPA